MDAAYTGKQIAQRRKDLGLTQKELAEKLHVTDKAVSKWERGVNFPDLGLMEALAEALKTTPACLLGLENADQEEIVSSITQISNDQLVDSRKYLCITGWCILAAALLLLTGFLQDEMYSLLCKLIPALIFGALYLLFKSGAIRKWNWADMLTFYGAVFPVILYNLGYLVRDYGFPAPVEYACILVCAICTQLLFYRIMRDTWAKALPVIGLVIYNLWYLTNGNVMDEGLLCTTLCFAVWLILRKLDKTAQPLPVLKIAAASAAALVLFGFVFYDSLVKAYVNLRHDHLASYCESLLENSSSCTQYGPWKVSVYPDEDMVEFHTGGAGLGSESSYEGFYYSADDEYLPFHGIHAEIEIVNGTGWWSDGTDNHGTTRRIRESFYWFEAYF